MELEVNSTCMEIPKEDLDRFKAIYREEYGEEISDEEAYRIASKLLNLFRIVYKPFLEPEKKR